VLDWCGRGLLWTSGFEAAVWKTVWRQRKKYGVRAWLYVTRWDRQGRQFPAGVRADQAAPGAYPVPIQLAHSVREGGILSGRLISVCALKAILLE